MCRTACQELLESRASCNEQVRLDCRFLLLNALKSASRCISAAIQAADCHEFWHGKCNGLVIGSLVFFAVGYGIMFGEDRFGLFGTSGWFLSAGNTAGKDGLWEYAYWMFQVVFAATSATIVSGAMAERTKFVTYLIYSAVIRLVIYPVVGHWIWGGGWLSKLSTPMIDFAGSTVVHSVGGWMALTGAVLLGPRLGKYGPQGTPRPFWGTTSPWLPWECSSCGSDGLGSTPCVGVSPAVGPNALPGAVAAAGAM